MRIRKRKVPLPLSLLSPVPLSDPHLFSRSPVTPVQEDDHSAHSSSVSDHLTSDLHSSISSTTDHDDVAVVVKSDHLVKKHLQLGRCLELGTAEGVQKCSDSSKEDIIVMGAAADNNGSSPFSNDEEVGRWCDGDKAIPLKKRRGSFANTAVKSTTCTYKDNENEAQCDDSNNNHNNERDQMEAEIINTLSNMHKDDNGTKNNNSNKLGGAKKGNKRGNTIMEGSRCSRVNGRGWRCCQPTLVGYSLCEHHLGKGRLRSMTSVRGQTSLPKKAALGESISRLSEVGPKEGEATNKVKIKRKATAKTNSTVAKRAKLGVVKARSLSSLLGQTSNPTTYV